MSEEIRAGDSVLVLTADGEWLERIAVSPGCVNGRDFPIVRVCRPEVAPAVPLAWDEHDWHSLAFYDWRPENEDEWTFVVNETVPWPCEDVKPA